MYITQIYNQNIGPIEKNDIPFSREGQNAPKPTVFVGENGSGKSTIISNIVDAIYEIAGTFYNNAREPLTSGGYQYYKAIAPPEIHIGANHMVSYIGFGHNNKKFQYIFKSGEITKATFESDSGIKLLGSSWREDLSFKSISTTPEDAKKIFAEEVFCYFGPDRYEKPLWLGDKYYNIDDHIEVKQLNNGELYNPISIKNATAETLKWLLDIILDSKPDIEYGRNGAIQVGQNNAATTFITMLARDNIEKILSTILGRVVKFRVMPRSAKGSRFTIIDAKNGSLVAPTLDSLSTGQSALFNMFTTIVRYADNNHMEQSLRLSDIAGIVVIDEIELHLHAKLQKEVLPSLIQLFPKVQFIITSHSPLFLLGMRKTFGENGYDIYQMPDATPVSVERFSEFQRAYQYMTETEEYQSEIRSAIEKHTKKTLVIAEGPTDWRHLKNALIHQNIQNLDIEFLEYDPKDSETSKLQKIEMGSSNLRSMCEQYSKIPQPRKLIFVADADETEIVKTLSENGKLKNWGNNVFSMVLPIPKHREKTPQICIEHLYQDETIKTPVEISGIQRRLYLGNEFDENGLSENGELQCNAKNACGSGKINIIDGQTKKKVIKIQGNRNENLALSKMEFANAICDGRIKLSEDDLAAFTPIFKTLKEIDNLPTS